MRTLKVNTLLKNMLLGIFAVMIMTSFSSCAKKINFSSSSVVPAARGHVKIKKDNNNNYVIKIELLNLAESKRLQPSKQTYVVWMVTDQDLTRNIGRINTSTNMFSKKLKASFETVSSLKPTKIFLTAEDNSGIEYPEGAVVLSTEKFW
jgi:hypothetical protein